MTMTKTEAAAALAAVEQTEAASSLLQRYRHAAPYFELWGLVWVVGYGCTWLMPERVNLVWLLAVAGGMVGQGLLVQRSATAHAAGARGAGWRSAALCVLLFVFFIGTQLLFQPTNPAAAGAFAPLCCGVAYAACGLWFGTRFLVTGMVVIAVTLAGFLWMPSQFALWMALCGGGALLLTGQWLRRA